MNFEEKYFYIVVKKKMFLNCPVVFGSGDF